MIVQYLDENQRHAVIKSPRSFFFKSTVLLNGCCIVVTCTFVHDYKTNISEVWMGLNGCECKWDEGWITIFLTPVCVQSTWKAPTASQLSTRRRSLCIPHYMRGVQPRGEPMAVTAVRRRGFERRRCWFEMSLPNWVCSDRTGSQDSS